jgi:hypothetical protein
MNFHDLLAKMKQLDQPAVENTQVLDDAPVAECPPDMPPSPMSPSMSKPETPPPSMSLNLNAQGLDNIEELMKLMTKVNPDMINQPQSSGPSIEIEPMDKPSGLPSLGGLGDLDKGPLKMLPDLDKGEPEGDHPEPDADNMGGPSDNDADNKIDIIKMKSDKDESFGNSLDDSEPETMGIDAAIPDGDDLNKPKKSFSGKPFRGDNPMAANAYESTDLRASIRAELLRRLEEAKGVK